MTAPADGQKEEIAESVPKRRSTDKQARRPRARSGPSIWSRGFVFVLLVNLVINMGQYMMIAVVPKFAEALGATAVVVGLVTGAFAVTALAARPVVGPATFKFRNSSLLVVTTAVILLAFVCYGVADSIEVVIVGRLLHGVGMGLLAPVALALASESLPESKMASGIGVFSLGQAIAMALGPSVGLALVDAVGYRATFFTSAGTMLLALGLAFTVSSPPPQETGRMRFSWRRVVAPEALVPAVVIFFLAGAFSAVNSFVVLFGESRGVADIGLFFTAYAVTMLVARPIAGKIADRHGLASVITPAIVLFGVAFLLIAHARSLPAFIVAGVVSALGYGVCQPAVQSLSLMAVTKERRGVAGSTNYMGVDLAYLIMPVVAGAIASSFHTAGSDGSDGYSIMFLLMIIPVAAGLAVFLTFTLPKRNRQQGTLAS